MRKGYGMTHILIFNISGIDESAYRILYGRSMPGRQQRADRYLRQDDRIRCVCAGALLQFALGRDDFEIETTPSGKPLVKDRPDFCFNLSHSGDWVVIAYGNRPVGIDIEKIDWNTGKENIARRFFTADEQAFVFGQSEQGRAERFYEIWTSKESYLKYLGTGLRKALDSFSVLQLSSPNRFTLQPDSGYSLSLWTQEEAYDLTRLSVSDLL